MRGKKTDYVRAKNRTNLSTGDVIRVACDMLGINQAMLAKRSGIAESHISAIISGNKSIGKVVAKKLSEVLQISPGNILFAGEEPRKGVHIADAIEKHLRRLRAQQSKINSLLKKSIQTASRLEKSKSVPRNLLLDLRRIHEINEEEDITGIHVLAKRALGDSKGHHKN